MKEPGIRRLAWAYASAALFATPTHAERLLVIASGDTPPYQNALAGIGKLGVAVEAATLTSGHEPPFARPGKDTAVVALGAAAAAAVSRVAPPGPVVNCMVLDAGGPNAAGTINVSLQIPIATQILWLKRLLPNAHNVGILFDPAQSERRAAEGAAELARAGFVPVAEPVTGPTALPHALSRLINRVDVLHALPDTTVYAREHARALLLFSFRHQIPLIGPTEAWVKAGALYAIDWDYADLGRYCGALALARLAGAKAPAPAAPRTRVVVNARSAEQLRIKWDADTMRLVDRVYE
ncbi:MAG: hypothetical protein IT518_19160 [Burkholderiales bacterium]|nr:hypothetical protein [Burkholderiales bacterium]